MKLGYLVTFGLIYSLVYIFLALNVVGMEGRGPLLFLAPLRPFGLPWIILLGAMFLTVKAWSKQRSILFVVLMASHYVISAYYVLPFLQNDHSPEAESLVRIMSLRPSAFYYAAAWYVFGQIVIWIQFAAAIKRRHSWA